MTTITNDRKPFEIGEKRFYLPAKVESKCPKCGERACLDLNDDYLSYPTANEPFDLDMYCRNDECGEQWTVKVILSITLYVFGNKK